MNFVQIIIDDGYIYGLTQNGTIYWARTSLGHLTTNWEPLVYQEQSSEGVGTILTS